MIHALQAMEGRLSAGSSGGHNVPESQASGSKPADPEPEVENVKESVQESECAEESDQESERAEESDQESERAEESGQESESAKESDDDECKSESESEIDYENFKRFDRRLWVDEEVEKRKQIGGESIRKAAVAFMREDFKISMEFMQEEIEKTEQQDQSSSGDSAKMGAWVRTIAGGVLGQGDADWAAQKRRSALKRYRQQRDFLDNMPDEALIKYGPPQFQFTSGACHSEYESDAIYGGRKVPRKAPH